MEKIIKIFLVVFIIFISIGAFILVYLDGSETKIGNVSIPYQDPDYKTLYSGTLYYDLNLNVLTITRPPDKFYNATRYEIITDHIFTIFNGHQVRVYWDSDYQDYYGVRNLDIKPNQTKVVIGNKTKYRTEQREVTKKRWNWLWDEIKKGLEN